MYKIGKLIIFAAVFATGSVCAMEDLSLADLQTSNVINNTPGAIEHTAEHVAAKAASLVETLSDSTKKAADYVVVNTAKAVDAVTEKAGKVVTKAIENESTDVVESGVMNVTAPAQTETPLPQSFTTKIAESATKMGISFLNCGLSDETIKAQNKTYYAANTVKVIAVLAATYGIYRATKYVYDKYGKKMPKA